MEPSTGEKKRVVVVGGGVGGSMIAQTLQNDADVVLIDTSVSYLSPIPYILQYYCVCFFSFMSRFTCGLIALSGISLIRSTKYLVSISTVLLPRCR